MLMVCCRINYKYELIEVGTAEGARKPRALGDKFVVNITIVRCGGGDFSTETQGMLIDFVY